MADDEPDEVVTVNPRDLVRVQICYRRTGPAGDASPHGVVKLEVLMPRDGLKHWEGARQFKTVGQPNLNIVFEGRMIRPPVSGSLALGDDMEAVPASHDDEVRLLEQRREQLRLDIMRLETVQNNLSDQHLKVRKSYAEDEQRLQANLGAMAEQLRTLRANYTAEESAVHSKLATLLELEETVTGSMKNRIEKYDSDLTTVVNRESALNNRIEALITEARSKSDGSTFERILDRVTNNAAGFAGSKLGQDLITRLLRHI